MRAVNMSLVEKARAIRLQQIRDGKVKPNRLENDWIVLRSRKNFEAEQKREKESENIC